MDHATAEEISMSKMKVLGLMVFIPGIVVGVLSRMNRGGNKSEGGWERFWELGFNEDFRG